MKLISRRYCSQFYKSHSIPSICILKNTKNSCICVLKNAFMDTLLIKHLNLITQSEFGFERSSFAKLPWEQRLLGVIGACSTLKKKYGVSSNLYFSR